MRHQILKYIIEEQELTKHEVIGGRGLMFGRHPPLGSKSTRHIEEIKTVS